MKGFSNKELRKMKRFHYANPKKLEGLGEYTEWLESVLHNPCSIWSEDNGEQFLIEIRHKVARYNGLKIEIYSNEHPPPHFHVKSPNIDASFSIKNCEVIQGKIKPHDYDKIKYWHNHSKELLIQIWNNTRPDSCTVGVYRGDI